jgi:hypothetical protein
MDRYEERLIQAQRQLWKAEARVAQQAAVVEELDRPGHERAANKAREALAMMQTGVALARFCLTIELAWPDGGSDRQIPSDA